MSSSPILFPHAMEPATFVVDAIELAIRRNLPLATIDPSLTRAAAAAGVSLFVP
ncbi:MAG TPA: hypothetical protein VG097_17010 [Gemmata sp.]|jgi:hypothetical protein|nr:hypothetical protein [Gemmata sp.]